MTEFLDNRPTITFWIVGAAALVWNLIGLFFYYSQVTIAPETLEVFTVAQREFLLATPVWATSAHATAVTAGVFGSLLLLLRKSLCVPLFVLSLLGILLQDLDAFLLRDGLSVWGTNGIYLPLIVIVIAVGLVFYSSAAKRNRWLS